MGLLPVVAEGSTAYLEYRPGEGAKLIGGYAGPVVRKTEPREHLEFTKPVTSTIRGIAKGEHVEYGRGEAPLFSVPARR
jgi:hypothetical protein